MVAVGARAVTQGRNAGLAVALGIAVGAFIWACLAVLGLEAAFLIYGSYALIFASPKLKDLPTGFQRGTTLLFAGLFAVLGALMIYRSILIFA